MIREVFHEDIPACVNIIKQSFKTVADEFGFTEEKTRRGFSGIWIVNTGLCMFMRKPVFYADIGSLSVIDKFQPV